MWLTSLWWASSALMARMTSRIIAPSYADTRGEEEGGGGREGRRREGRRREGEGGRGRSYAECSLNRIPTLSAFGNRIVHLHVAKYPNTLLAARAGGCMLVTAIYTPPISLVK